MLTVGIIRFTSKIHTFHVPSVVPDVPYIYGVVHACGEQQNRDIILTVIIIRFASKINTMPLVGVHLSLFAALAARVVTSEYWTSR